MIKKAPIAFAFTSLLFSVVWVLLFHLGMLAVIDMKNDLIEAQTQEIALLKGGKPDRGEASKKDARSTAQPLKRVQGKRFVNEKVLLDGYSYVNCIFENVTFVYNGGLSEMINGTMPVRTSLRLLSNNKDVMQII